MAADFAKPANAELVQLQIDPHELGGVFRLMTAKSFQVYKNTWLDFTQFAGISVEKIPKEEDFARFFEMKRNAGLELDPIVPKKNPKLETDKDPTVSKTDDASELWGEDEDVEQVSEPLKEVVESAEKHETAGEDNNGNLKSFLKGFSFNNCTVNFQLPGKSFK